MLIEGPAIRAWIHAQAALVLGHVDRIDDGHIFAHCKAALRSGETKHGANESNPEQVNALFAEVTTTWNAITYHHGPFGEDHHVGVLEAAALIYLGQNLGVEIGRDDDTPLRSIDIARPDMIAPWLEAANEKALARREELLAVILKLLQEIDATDVADGLKQFVQSSSSQQEPLSRNWTPSPAIPEWTPSDNGIHGALLVLAGGIWNEVVGPRYKDHAAAIRGVNEAFAFPLGPRGRPARGQNRWTAVDGDLVQAALHQGTLQRGPSMTLFRQTATWAKTAYNHGQQRVELWRSDDGSQTIHAQAESDGATTITVVGGYRAMGDALGKRQGDIKSVVQALHTIRVRWSDDEMEYSTYLIQSLTERREGRSVLAFKLSEALSPAYPAYMANKGIGALKDRYLVPLNPDDAPSTNRKNAPATQRLEMLALNWIRDHLDNMTADGAEVPWDELAHQIQLSTAKQASRRRNTLQSTLQLWEKEKRWVRTGTRWRPVHGWELLQASKRSRASGRKGGRAKKKEK